MSPVKKIPKRGVQRDMGKVVHKKITAMEQPAPQRNEEKKKSKEIGREKRVDQIVRMGRDKMIKRAKELGFRNIQFKKIDKKDPSKNVNRDKKDIADLIYFKELELNL